MATDINQVIKFMKVALSWPANAFVTTFLFCDLILREIRLTLTYKNPSHCLHGQISSIIITHITNQLIII